MFIHAGLATFPPFISLSPKIVLTLHPVNQHLPNFIVKQTTIPNFVTLVYQLFYMANTIHLFSHQKTVFHHQ